MEEKIREFICDTRSEAEQVAENHRQNYADWVDVSYDGENFVVTAGYSE